MSLHLNNYYISSLLGVIIVVYIKRSSGFQIRVERRGSAAGSTASGVDVSLSSRVEVGAVVGKGSSSSSGRLVVASSLVRFLMCSMCQRNICLSANSTKYVSGPFTSHMIPSSQAGPDLSKFRIKTGSSRAKCRSLACWSCPDI